MTIEEFIHEFKNQNFPDHCGFILVRSEPRENSFFPDFYMDIKCIDKDKIDSLDVSNFQLFRNGENSKLPIFMINNVK